METIFNLSQADRQRQVCGMCKCFMEVHRETEILYWICICIHFVVMLWRIFLAFDFSIFAYDMKNIFTDVHKALASWTIFHCFNEWRRRYFISLSVSPFFSLFLSFHISSATVTSATWGQLQSHVPHFHPQQWSHMFVKMCMLCAFSGPICSHAFSPMSPALPGGRSWSLTLFIQTEQLGPSQPKQWGMGREIIMETSG